MDIGKTGTAHYSEIAASLESRWRKYWDDEQIYLAPNPGAPGFNTEQAKLVVLDFFPYPSGAGLHIGHPRGYVATDVFARFERMRGRNVLHAMGFDSFGLPAEQYAIQTGQHPRVTTENNIANMQAQLKLLGLGHDPSRGFCTSSPSYYRWTQWLFIQMFDSFYDPNAERVGGAKGRARPIGELEAYLCMGEWLLDAAGAPVPKDRGGRRAIDVEVPRALDLARLAYLETVPVNWCPALGTVLSNEEVTADGKSERGNHPVFKRSLKQWMLRITAYADRLIEDLQHLDWPAGVLKMQRDWIGKSEGAEIVFGVATLSGRRADVTVFTTRPDTLMGVTYLALAPSHPLVPEITTPEHQDEVEAYVKKAQSGSTAGAREVQKTGTFTGTNAIHPLTGAPVPIWVADYVIEGHGTGAVMAVPAHDTRDFEFARRFELPVRAVLTPDAAWLEKAQCSLEDYLTNPTKAGAAYTARGTLVSSSFDKGVLDGVEPNKAPQMIVDILAKRGLGRPRITYRLRDWLFSRQRYWGEPFPIVFDDQTGRPYAVSEQQLPVTLPDLDNFAPSPDQDVNSEPDLPLGRAKTWKQIVGAIVGDRVHVLEDARVGDSVDIGGKEYRARAFRRETNTMPNWAGSCWYYFRYFDTTNESAFVGKEVERYWSGADATTNQGAVDLYVGGAEHAVLHLLYARFWHKVLYDRGLASTSEPFQRLVNQGMITADAFCDSRGVYVDPVDVSVTGEHGNRQAVHRRTGEKLDIVPGKMGKRYKNGIPPEEVAAQYSVDSFRTYQMYLGPLESSLPWLAEGIVGMHRFLSAVWTMVCDQDGIADDAGVADPELERLVHRTVKAVTDDLERLRFNTALAHIIELHHALKRQPLKQRRHLVTLALLLAPFAPHLGEEALSRLVPAEHRRLKSAIRFSWPSYDAAQLTESVVTVVVQVNGKKKALIDVPVDITAADLEARARADSKVGEVLTNAKLVKVVTAMKPKPQIINFVVAR